ncbi:GAF domain-containing protein [Amycolatopsis oliviviridis]|uniref:GAF domain-containing protein n=1 Tax=Amycolatopsis oliviviridis TaxID=1471590 RepID=UPI001749C2DC|nr:GAF domain-containing protein [Amycolatopsis oliviviridis]
MTRRTLICEAYRRGDRATDVLFDPEFLSLADAPAVMQAILFAALTVGAADSCDLQLYHPHDGTLRIRAQHGFSPAFLTTFGTLTATQPSACVAALTTRRPVLVDDVTRSLIFTGQPTLDLILDAGTRAVASYPLHTGNGNVFGVLSFHYRRAGLQHGHPGPVVLGASQALANRIPRWESPAIQGWTDVPLLTAPPPAGTPGAGPRRMG